MAATSLFLALTREDARRLFGLPGGDRLWSFVSELRDSENISREGRKAVCETDWRMMHEQLAGEGYPLDQCFLGGRDMTLDASGRALLKRPDVVAHIAGALENRPADHPPPPELREFYRRAAEEKCAVLFVLKIEAGE